MRLQGRLGPPSLPSKIVCFTCKTKKKRRGWDSNPRDGLTPPTRFPVALLRPTRTPLRTRGVYQMEARTKNHRPRGTRPVALPYRVPSETPDQKSYAQLPNTRNRPAPEADVGLSVLFLLIVIIEAVDDPSPQKAVRGSHAGYRTRCCTPPTTRPSRRSSRRGSASPPRRASSPPTA